MVGFSTMSMVVEAKDRSSWSQDGTSHVPCFVVENPNVHYNHDHRPQRIPIFETGQQVHASVGAYPRLGLHVGYYLFLLWNTKTKAGNNEHKAVRIRRKIRGERKERTQIQKVLFSNKNLPCRCRSSS
jgi:hypothetical protein